MPQVKINRPGLKLREKSPVHAKIIDENTGRRKTDVRLSVSEVIKRHEQHKTKEPFNEHWSVNGGDIITNVEKKRFDYDRAILDISSRNQKKPLDICVLGPGEGSEAVYLKNLYSDIPTNIDTLGIVNYLSKDARSIVRKDYSPHIPSNKTVFEHMNHLHLVNKYDYIYSYLGPAHHTNYSEIAILKIASMLRPGGFARIRVKDPIIIQNIKKYLALKKLENKILLNFDCKFILINKLK